eukprot:363910-Chlamydomonas_euryale.AAC.14
MQTRSPLAADTIAAQRLAGGCTRTARVHARPLPRSRLQAAAARGRRVRTHRIGQARAHTASCKSACAAAEPKLRLAAQLHRGAGDRRRRGLRVLLFGPIGRGQWLCAGVQGQRGRYDGQRRLLHCWLHLPHACGRGAGGAGGRRWKGWLQAELKEDTTMAQLVGHSLDGARQIGPQRALKKTIVFASASGALTATRKGAIEGQPKLSECEELAATAEQWHNFW